MNLHQIAGPLIGAVNPMTPVSVKVSTGWTTNPDGTRVPTYADPVSILAQVQPISFRDIQQMDGLNLNGSRRVFYLSGSVDGLNRPTNQGGDLITFPDGTVWLVAMVLEGYSFSAGWCKVAATLQNGS